MERFFAVIILLGVAITMTTIGLVWIKTTMESMRWKPEILKITRCNNVPIIKQTTPGI